MRTSTTVVGSAEIEALAVIGREWREKLMKQYEAELIRAIPPSRTAARRVCRRSRSRGVPPVALDH